MIRAFQWDLARQVERPGWLESLLPRYADWGYAELYLHLEDAVEYPSVPGVARKDAFRYGQLESLVAAAGRRGIGVVPIVNLLGHTQYLVKVPALRDLNELRDAAGRPLPSGQICPVHPGTLELAERLLRDMRPFCTAGKVHVGLDESFHLGRHPLSRREISSIGLTRHFAGYVNRLHDLTARLGLRMGYWADMLYFLPGAIPLLPRGSIAYDWYYYPFPRLPRVELFNFAERDLAAPLQARGIEYWGCPMNSGFRHEPMPVVGERLDNVRSWWRRCREVGAAGMLITSWETGRIAAELPVAIDAAAASLWLGRGGGAPSSLLADGFVRSWPRLGRARARRAAAIALAADRTAFAGYWRWEADQRWDAMAYPDIPKQFERELREVRRAVREARGLPTALVSSLRFRVYLAERDLFVRESARTLLRLRRLERDGDAIAVRRGLAGLAQAAVRFRRIIAEGEKAAQSMWARTRGRPRDNPNLGRIDADRKRLDAWVAWLKRARRDTARLRGSTPVCGGKQLLFTVLNFAPALQRVVVEESDGRGGWKVVHGRFTIEFRAAAATPAGRKRRRMSVPLDAGTSRVRIGVRGAGQVRLEDLRLVEGAEVRSLAARRAVLIGKSAPRRGLPALDWERSAGAAMEIGL